MLFELTVKGFKERYYTRSLELITKLLKNGFSVDVTKLTFKKIYPNKVQLSDGNLHATLVVDNTREFVDFPVTPDIWQQWSPALRLQGFYGLENEKVGLGILRVNFNGKMQFRSIENE